tara:strand:+ start:296 stop:514 length:219 start_codon:yes stop_codon:yes gene_type:complete
MKSRRMTEWIETSCTPINAMQWNEEREKWLFAERCLVDAGCNLSLTDNPVSMEWMVGKVEDYFLEFRHSLTP